MALVLFLKDRVWLRHWPDWGCVLHYPNGTFFELYVLQKEGSRSMERDEVDLFDTSINNMDVDFHVRSEVEDDFFGGRNTAAEEVDDFTAASSTGGWLM